MVAGKDNDGVLIQMRVLQEREQFADLVIYVGAVAEIGSASTQLRLLRDGIIPGVNALQNALGVRILVLLPDRDFWLGDIDVCILLPK